MKVEQGIWLNGKWDKSFAEAKLQNSAQLVFVFGATDILKQGHHISAIKELYPRATLFGCSTAGEICGTDVYDDSIVVTAVYLEKTSLQTCYTKIDSNETSFQAGEILGKMLNRKELAHVFILSDGLAVNGSDLVRGISKHLPEGVVVTGGLAGDGSRFKETLVFQDNHPERNTIGAVGFYGKGLKVGCGSFGGWDSFGPERLVTRSKGNILYELDGESALALYKKYLGEYASGLPSTGLLFPLSIRTREKTTSIVRTILAVDETRQSLTFAGDIPEGSYARLMKANFDRLIDGAVKAAGTTYLTVGSFTPELAILISCVGRKLILKQRVEEEIEGVRETLGNDTVLTGFYSYGEIAPFTPGANCELHNQIMTITAFSEK